MELRTIEAAAAIRAEAGDASPAAAPPDQDLDDEPVTPSKVADRLGIPDDDKRAREAVRKRLANWRFANPGSGGFIEVADPKPKQPRFFHRLRTVWPIVEGMKRSG